MDLDYIYVNKIVYLELNTKNQNYEECCVYIYIYIIYITIIFSKNSTFDHNYQYKYKNNAKFSSWFQMQGSSLSAIHYIQLFIHFLFIDVNMKSNFYVNGMQYVMFSLLQLIYCSF